MEGASSSRESGALREALRRLRTGFYSGVRTPHKLLLLSSIARLLREDPDHPNRFTFEELEPVFLSAFESLAPSWPRHGRQLEYPFFHLQRDGFWHLKVTQGKEQLYRQYLRTRLTRARLLETIEFGYLDDLIFHELMDPSGGLTVERELIGFDQGEPSGQASGRPVFPHEQWAVEVMRREVERCRLGQTLGSFEVYDSQGDCYLEYDAAIIARCGIYVVDLKHWAGHIRVAREQWTINEHRYRDDPHRGNRYKCQVLKGMYERQFPSYPTVWVTSVVVLTNPDATVENADSPSAAQHAKPDYLTFSSIADFLEFLRRRDAGPYGALLTDTQVSGVYEFLKSRLTPARSRGYAVPGYETVDYLFQGPDRIELVARRTDGRSRGLFRIRVFRLPAQASPEERERARRRAFNTVDAVNRIGDHPNVHRVTVWQNDEGDILELSDWSETGTLKHLLAKRREPLPIDRAMNTCRGIALALAEAHRQGIYHRAVKPQHVLMMNDVPKLTDFDLSYDLDRPADETTVIPDRSVLDDDGYTAPELLDAKDFSEATDIFGLGVIACELVTGEKPFSSVRRMVARGGRLTDDQVGRLRERGLPDSAVEAIRRAVVADPRERLGDAARMAEALGPVSPAVEAPPNAPLSQGSTYDIYQIAELIGRGAEGQVYRALAEGQEQVAIKLFDREVPRERISSQLRNASSVSSKYIVRHASRPGLWRGDRFFSVMEYVDGGSLRQRIERGERPDRESFRRVGLGLLEALRAMHERTDDEGQLAPLIHGDVKPDNVLMTPAGEPKLTDFSVAGPPRTDRFQGTPGYVPPDRILETEMQFTQDGDLFALGVTLWEYSFGARPYASPSVGARPSIPAGEETRLPPALRRWLEKAVSTAAAERFASAVEMRDEFLAAEAGAERVLQRHPPGKPGATWTTVRQELPARRFVAPCTVPVAPGNPFVAYLNTLANTTPANDGAIAEAQQPNPFFHRIWVANPVSDSLWRWLVDERRNVILTGNAGDGKTTVAAEVYRRLTGESLPSHHRTEAPTARIVIVKDMSELEEEDRARILEEAFGATDRRFLIVSNTGRLLSTMSRASFRGLDPSGRESELLSALEADEAVDILDGRFRLLNMARTDSIDTACRVFRRMLEGQNWSWCEQCPSNSRCPVRENALLAQENEETLQRRVELLFRRVYEYGVRLTMRQMTGHLAYSLTGGLNCSDVRQMSEIALVERGGGYLFFDRFFGDDGSKSAPEAGQLELVKRGATADFGTTLDPWFEREVWRGDPSRLPLAGRALELYRAIRGEGESAPAGARRQIRRLVYFFGQFRADQQQAERRYIATFLRSPMLLDYLEVARGDGRVPGMWQADWRRRIVQVLQEQFLGVRLPEGSWQDTDMLHITLNRRSAGAPIQMVLASFGTREFEIVARRLHAAVEGSGWRLSLVKRGSAAELPLDLPFLDYVAGRCEGEVAAELSAFYADRLERFQAQLLAADDEARPGDSGLTLLRVGRDGRLSPVELRFGDGLLEVL